MVEEPKPSPMVYQFAANQLGLQPEECIVVEDSFSGATAAVAAQMQVIGFLGAGHILPGHAEKLLQIGAVDTVKQMDTLPTTLAKYI